VCACGGRVGIEAMAMARGQQQTAADTSDTAATIASTLARCPPPQPLPPSHTLNSLTHMVRHRGSPIVPTASHTHAGQQGLGERRRHGLRAGHQGEGHPPELARRAPRHPLVGSRPASEQEEGAARLGQDAAAAYVRCVPCMVWPGATADPPCASQSTSSCGSRPTPIARRRT